MDPEIKDILILMVSQLMESENFSHFAEERALMKEVISDLRDSRFHRMAARRTKTLFWKSRAVAENTYQKDSFVLLDSVMGLVVKLSSYPDKNHKHVPDWDLATIDDGLVRVPCHVCGKVSSSPALPKDAQWK
jgi:hypothetical protein